MTLVKTPQWLLAVARTISYAFRLLAPTHFIGDICDVDCLGPRLRRPFRFENLNTVGMDGPSRNPMLYAEFPLRFFLRIIFIARDRIGRVLACVDLATVSAHYALKEFYDVAAHDVTHEFRNSTLFEMIGDSRFAH